MKSEPLLIWVEGNSGEVVEAQGADAFVSSEVETRGGGSQSAMIWSAG